MRSFLTLGAIALCLTAAHAAAPTRDEVLATALPAADRTFKSATTEPTPPALASRELFSAALTYAESGQNLDRILPMLELAARMQDTDPASRGHGNFRWSWRDPSVMDYNAVDFCMQGGTLLWRHHRDKLSAATRDRLRALLELGATGCMKHRVNPNYTNIALMNAGNLIFLGELLGKTDVADEGYRRLNGAAQDIWTNGVHEYLSPTYYGVDLNDLVMIEADAQRADGVAVARALLEVFSQQVALTWFEPNQRLGGPASRDYDYLRGLGMLHVPLWVWGWPIGRTVGGSDAVFTMLTRWRPDAATQALPTTALPRLVRGKYGPSAREAWTYYCESDVALGSAGSCYHNMDIPLALQFAGGNQQIRGYFIADGRHDPYGKVKIQEGTGPHSKTLHLLPFWTAAQTKHDVLAYVAYPPAAIPEGTQTLESHLVLPRNVDSLWLDDQRLAPAGKQWQVPVPAGATVTVRRGTASASIKVVAARGCDGKPAGVALVDDGNEFGAIRLTISHGAAGAEAAAVVWVRVAGSLANDEAAALARRGFIAAKGTAELRADGVTAQATGPDGDLRIEVGPKFGGIKLAPKPSRALLEHDGKDIGRQRLGQLEPFRTWAAAADNLPVVTLATDRDTSIEAESGAIHPNFVVADDPAASGGKFVWAPGEPGAGGAATGWLRWRIKLAKATRLYAFGRVIAPTPDDDSFFFGVRRDDEDVAEPTTWSTGTHTAWAWSPIGTVDLPAGESLLEIRGREDGTKLDRLLFSRQADLPR